MVWKFGKKPKLLDLELKHSSQGFNILYGHKKSILSMKERGERETGR